MVRRIYLTRLERNFPAGRCASSPAAGKGYGQNVRNWLRDGKTPILDDVAIAGLEYTLPKTGNSCDGNDTGWLNSLQLKEI